MKIEAITVCVNYSDFLAQTLLFNKPQFDRFVVVTDCNDWKTRDVCEFHHVQCVTTDAFYNNEKAFDKGAGITEGLKALDCTDWVCHLDADIALPPRSRNLLERMNLDPQGIYGCDRMMCESFIDWSRFVSNPEVQHSCDVYVTANAFRLGTRIAKMNNDGYVPIGFFQLWNARATKRYTYPSHGQADRSDMRFALQWPRARRHLIPEFVAVHLESTPGNGMGQNWRGRRSQPFGPNLDRYGIDDGNEFHPQPQRPPVPPTPLRPHPHEHDQHGYHKDDDDGKACN